jgi:outer membrane protein OmpA-like peptidoglycan-associated protein
MGSVTSLAVFSALVLAFITPTLAEKAKVEGVIVGRSGNIMIVEYAQGAELAFLLDDSTKVTQAGGVFKLHNPSKSMAALIPGLKVKVEGTYNDSRQIVATSVKFKGDDLEQAQVAEAANRQSHNESRKQQEELKAELERQAAALKQQNEQLQLQEAQLAEHKAQIEAAVARFGQLDDYYIFDELTVYFDNGKVKVDPKYEASLLELVKKAEGVDGYVISVTGYASSSGSTSVNQKLSEDRANGMTNILLLDADPSGGCDGRGPPSRHDKSAEGQAENRRVVVRVLQNKAIAGI